MGNKAHIRFVNAHAERNRGDHDNAVLPQESGLPGRTLLLRQTRVIRHRINALLTQVIRKLLRRLARQTVDNARLTRMLILDQLHQLPARRRLLRNPVLNVRPIKTRNKMARLTHGQPPRQFIMGSRGGGCRQCDTRHGGKTLMQNRQTQVVSPKIMTPLGHTVRLINGKQRNLCLFEEAKRPFLDEPFGSQVQKIQIT